MRTATLCSLPITAFKTIEKKKENREGSIMELFLLFSLQSMAKVTI